LFKSARRVRPYGSAMFGITTCGGAALGHRDTAAVRHSGRATVVAALRSFFAPRSRTDGTVRMGVVFHCALAERAR
jgi:hypothetical protein